MNHQAVGILAILALIVPACGPSSRPSTVSRGLDDYVRLARSVGADAAEEEGSVWTDRAGYGDAFRDVKARRPADILTIQVLESTSAISEASTETAKSSNVDKQYGSLAGLEGRIAELANLVDISQSSQFSGDASTSRRSVLSTTITTRVVEVFPNRNLLIEGNREVVINGERQIVTLRGVVRPADVTVDNTVLSSRIAEMELEVTGRGLVSDAQKPGVLYRILSGIWPF
jgi:flagellar L-ring protein FlgH